MCVCYFSWTFWIVSWLSLNCLERFSHFASTFGMFSSYFLFFHHTIHFSTYHHHSLDTILCHFHIFFIQFEKIQYSHKFHYSKSFITAIYYSFNKTWIRTHTQNILGNLNRQRQENALFTGIRPMNAYKLQKCRANEKKNQTEKPLRLVFRISTSQVCAIHVFVLVVHYES